jgi:hypothetical protein
VEVGVAVGTGIVAVGLGKGVGVAGTTELTGVLTGAGERSALATDLAAPVESSPQAPSKAVPNHQPFILPNNPFCKFFYLHNKIIDCRLWITDYSGELGDISRIKTTLDF